MRKHLRSPGPISPSRLEQGQQSLAEYLMRLVKNVPKTRSVWRQETENALLTASWRWSMRLENQE